MAVEKYTTATSRGSILGSELDALASGSICAVGTEIDNSANLDRWAIAVLSVDFVTGPTALSVCQLYGLIAVDGTNYEQGGITSGGIPPPEASLVGTFQLDDTTTAQRVASNAFRLRGPFKHKFCLRNRSGQSFPASGSTVTLYTFNREIA